MKKIPTLFKRHYNNPSEALAYDEVTPGLEWVLEGEGIATIKVDGTCCYVCQGEFYRRYDAKKGRTPPTRAIPCCEPDPITGHWPHWIKVTPDDAGANWHLAAYYNAGGKRLKDGTYEAVGPHFQANPYHLPYDVLIKHGAEVVSNCPRSFEGLKDFLHDHDIEGIVFWKNGEPQCKIKRSDFGFAWPNGNPTIRMT